MSMRHWMVSLAFASAAFASDEVPISLEETRKERRSPSEIWMTVDKPFVWGGGNREWMAEVGYLHRLSPYIQLGIFGSFNQYGQSYFDAYNDRFEDWHQHSLGLRFGPVFSLSEDFRNAFYIAPTVMIEKYLGNRGLEMSASLEIGKRFQITENLTYRPSVSLVGGHAQYGGLLIQPLGASWNF